MRPSELENERSCVIKNKRRHLMTKVFIGGSRSITKLSAPIVARIDRIIENNFHVLVGDASGVDLCVQKYLAERGYLDVFVFCTDLCRNNHGNWKTTVISARAGEKGFEFYALKDRVMAREADYGFMVWEGKSRGTLSNIVNLLAGRKKSWYFSLPRCPFIQYVLMNIYPPFDREQ
jgi:hypothetical protein